MTSYEDTLAVLREWLAFLDDQERQLNEQLAKLRRKGGADADEEAAAPVQDEAEAPAAPAEADEAAAPEEKTSEPWL